MAYTGFLVNRGSGEPVCAPTSQDAIDALGARFPYVAGAQPSLCNLESSVFTAPNTFTNTIMCHDLTGGQQWTFSHPLKLARCDPALFSAPQSEMMFADGLSMGWGVVGAMIAALAVIHIKQALFQR